MKGSATAVTTLVRKAQRSRTANSGRLAFFHSVVSPSNGAAAFLMVSSNRALEEGEPSGVSGAAALGFPDKRR